MEFANVTLSEIQRYLELTGKKGSLVISILGRLTPQLNSILNNEMGREMLRDDINRLEELLMKIYKEEATEIERAEFRYLKDRRFPYLIEKLKVYINKVDEIKKVSRSA